MPSEVSDVREEFNRWAEAGRAEEMEAHHRPFTEPALELMRLRADERVMDLGCGNGWLSRQIAALVPQGTVVGMDVSEEMLRRAERASAGLANLRFLPGSAQKIPWRDDSFTRVISVESAFYWPDPAQGLAEIFRVLSARGSLWIIITYYRDNAYCHHWGAQFAIPTHLLGADEWAELFRRTGFVNVRHRRIPDLSPTPEVYNGPWFRDAEQMRRFKQEGALLIVGTKPASDPLA